MSYNKFLNKIQYNPNTENGLLKLDSSNQILTNTNNFKIFEKVNENIKISKENNKDLILLNISGSYVNTSGSIQTYENINSNNFVVDSLYFLNVSNDLILSSSKEMQFTSGNVDINSKFLSKKIYGNIQYVNSSSVAADNILWIQPNQSNNIKLDVDSIGGGFKLTKKNVHLEYLTYVTCNPDSTSSTYSKDDIIANTGITGSYNFVNDEGTFTNCLYFRPGSTENTMKRYLSGCEHTFVFDFQKDLLPGWGFESNHPLNNISSYTSVNLKDGILNDIDSKKKSQSIILDLSKLIDSNNVSPGYKINLIFKDPILDYPESLPAIIHSSNNIEIGDSNDNWVNYTFDSMCANFAKSDLDINSIPYSRAKSDLNLLIPIPAPQNVTSSVNLTPYYNTIPIPVIPLVGPSCVKYGCGATFPSPYNYTYNYYRQFGQYYNNKIILHYFKPLFFLNLGKNNILLNENTVNPDLKKITFLSKQNPYFINQTFFDKLKTILNKEIDIKYFVMNNISNESYSHLNLLDENNTINQISNSQINPPNSQYSYIETNSSNLYKNFTFKLDVVKNGDLNYYTKFKSLFLISLYRNYSTTPVTYSCSNRSICGAGGVVSTNFISHVFNFIKSKVVYNIPFTYLKNVNVNDLANVNNFDFYFLDSFKLNLNTIKYKVANKDLSINDINLENSNSLNNVNNTVIQNPYSIDITQNNFIKKYQNTISLTYLGKNPNTQRNEWIYS